MDSPSRLHIALDPASPAPVFVQIGEVVRQAVNSGSLPAGTRLPTTRALARELGVAVNTVAKAYRELEVGGVVEGRGRRGTFVVDQSGTAAEREAVRFVRAAQDLGLSKERALELVGRAWG